MKSDLAFAFALTCLGVCVACAWAQGANETKPPTPVPSSAAEPPSASAKKQTSKTQTVFGGGGIRGALGDAVDADANRWLVSSTEARDFGGETGYNEPPILRPRAINPGIEIIKPDPPSGVKLQSPFSIQVSFKSMSDAAIDPSTFRVFYGALKIDITQRIAGHVKLTAQGFSLDQAQIPKGKHRLTLQIQDEKQRVAERELRIEVE